MTLLVLVVSEFATSRTHLINVPFTRASLACSGGFRHHSTVAPSAARSHTFLIRTVYRFTPCKAPQLHPSGVNVTSGFFVILNSSPLILTSPIPCHILFPVAPLMLLNPSRILTDIVIVFGSAPAVDCAQLLMEPSQPLIDASRSFHFICYTAFFPNLRFDKLLASVIFSLCRPSFSSVFAFSMFGANICNCSYIVS